MEPIHLPTEYLKELESEARATRQCLERVPVDKSDWKPHEKSMKLGYLALLVAEIPLWIAYMIDKGELDYGTFEHFKAKTADELVRHFDENMEAAKKALEKISNDDLQKPFHLKFNGRLMFTSKLKGNVWSSINHMVHHRGQLTVYLRLNDISVPSIYGPSADDRGPIS